jgi:hypothetical protein
MAPSVMGGYGSNQTAGNGGMSVAIVLGSLVLLALIVLLARRRSPRRPTQPSVLRLKFIS